MKTNYPKSRMLTTFRFAVLLLFVLATSTSWAQVIAGWQFGTPASKGDEANARATTYSQHIEQPVLTRGNGVQPYALGRGFSAINWMLTYDSFNSALGGNYYEFTIRTDDHYKASISSIKARLRRSDNGPRKYQWAYSINNAPFVAIGSVGTLSDAIDNGQLITVNTSAIAGLQNKLMDEFPLILRLCAWDAVTETGTFAFGRTPIGTTTNSIEVNGVVTPVNSPPSASTRSVADVRSTSAIIYGSITDAGYPRASNHGFCWSTNPLPTIDDNKIDFGPVYSKNEFMSSIENLAPGTKYYIRTYAKNNSTPAVYGQVLSFTTKAAATDVPNIVISFTGSGNSTTVDNVLVENLTTGQSKIVDGNTLLYLNPQGSGSTATAIVDVLGTVISSMNVYPNPTIATSTLSFGMPEPGVAVLSVSDMSGKAVSNYSNYLTAGNYKFQLPALRSGVYLVTLAQNGFKKTHKLVSINSGMTDFRQIQVIEKLDFVELDNKPHKVSAVSNAVEGMVYNDGNQLRFTASSGRCKTIFMDKPSKSKTLDFRFIECIDGDDNAYAVVKIGMLYWMVENLKTTKKIDGTPLAKVTGAAWAGLTSTSEAYCYYNDVDANAAMFGALYTHSAAKTNLAPLGGWRLPTKKEFIQMAGYLDGRYRAGAKLKEIGSESWTSENKFATNLSGFGAKASGIKVGSTFSPHQTIAAFWHADETNDNKAAFAKLTSAHDSIGLYADTLKAAGLSVRYVFEAPDPRPQLMEGVFGAKPTENIVNTKGLPLPANTVLMAPDKELFFTGRHNTSLTPQMRFMDNPTSTTAPFIASLQAIAAGGVKWWENPKKVTTMVNENGRESTVIAVWNEAVAGQSFGYKNVTLHIIGDESVNYAHRSVVLPDKFWMPEIVSGDPYTGKALNPYDIQECWQWEMNVRTGDVTGDGVPEILVAVHDTLRIYDSKTFQRISQRGFASDFNQSKNFAFYLRVEVADMNQDGLNDVIVMTSTPKSFELTTVDHSKSVRLHMFMKGNIEATNVDEHKKTMLGNSFNASNSHHARIANFAVGDVNNDGKPEISILYAYGSSNVTHRGTIYCTFDWVVGGNNPFVFKANNTVGGGYTDWSVLQPIVLAKLMGPSGPNYIVNSDVIFFVDDNGEINYPRDPDGVNNSNYYFLTKDIYGFKHVIFGDQIVVGNFDKDPSGREMLYYIANIKDTSPAATTDNLKIYSTALNQTTGEVILNTNPVPFFNENSGNLLSKNHFPVIAGVNTRHTGRVLQFQRHEYMLTKPKLIAALAAAPYYDGYYDTRFSPSTSWSKSTFAGIGKDTLATHTASAIVGYEHEFSIPLLGTKFGFEFTAKASFGFSKNYASTETTTVTVNFSGEENIAVVSSSPYDAFFYKILKSDNPLEINTEVMFGFPRKMKTEAITVEEYNKLIEGQNAPLIDKSVFRHTLGNPFSYPYADAPASIKLSNLPSSISSECATDFVGVGQGSLSSVSIGKETVNTTTTGFSQDYDFELVGTVGGFKLGAGYGYNKEKTESTSVGSGFQVEGAVPGLLNVANGYQWALKWYNYQKSGYTFQVVNYLVKR